MNLKTGLNFAAYFVILICLIVIGIGLVDSDPLTWGIGLGILLLTVGVAVFSKSGEV